MRPLSKMGLFLLLFFSCFTTKIEAQTSPPSQVSIPQATVRLPKCLQYPDSQTFTPCTGIVPVEKDTGNPLDWRSLVKGSVSDPVYTAPVINGSVISTNNPVPIICGNCSGGGGGGGFSGNPSIQGVTPAGSVDTSNPVPIGFNDGSNVQRLKGNPTTGALFTEEAVKRVHWNETSTPLGINEKFNGASHDDGGSISGSPTRWNTFGCFAASDQAGVLNLQASNDNITWFTVQTRNMNTAGSVYLGQPLFTKYWRCQVINGSVSQAAFVLNSAFGS